MQNAERHAHPTSSAVARAKAVEPLVVDTKLIYVGESEPVLP